MNQVHETLLTSSGFEIGPVHLILTESQLQLQNEAGLSLIDFLSLEDNASVQMLQEDLAFKSLLLQSLTHHQYPIPNNWQTLSDFSLVCPKDTKVTQKNILNGLFYYCSQYAQEHQRPFEPIVRTNGNRALLFTLDTPERHLTIDETISSFSDRTAVNTYAHVTYKKGQHTLRFYFSNELKLVKTTAFIEEHQQKMPILNLETLDIRESDYQIGLELLGYLKTQQELQIKDLDIKLTPKFLFISSQEIFDDCQQLVREINTLKSPIVDRREHILQRLKNQDIHAKIVNDWKQPSAASNTIINDNSMNNDTGKTNFIKNNNPVKNKNNPTISKKTQMLNCIHNELLSIRTTLNILNSSPLQLQSLFNQFQAFQITLIQTLHFLNSEQKQHFENQCEAITKNLLKIIYKSYQEKVNEYLKELYDLCGEFIDGLLMGLINKFQKRVLVCQDYSPSETEEIMQMFDLIMHFHDQNKLYVDYLKLLRDQCIHIPQEQTILSALFRVFFCFNLPKFNLFLIEKNILKPTDCIGILEGKYISWYQLLLLYFHEIHIDYQQILGKCSSELVPFLEITKKLKFESLAKASKKISTLDPSSGQIKPLNRSNRQLLDTISSSIQGARDISILEFGLLFSSFQNTHQLHFAHVIALQNPALAIVYIAYLVDNKHIYRRMINTLRNSFTITQSPEELWHLTRDLISSNDNTVQLTPDSTPQNLGFIYLALITFIFITKLLENSYLYHQLLDFINHSFINQETTSVNNEQTLREEQARQCVGYIYFIQPDAPKSGRERLQLASTFLQLLMQQDFLKPNDHIPTFITELYQAILNYPQPEAQIIGILAIQLYMASIPNWNAEFYKKFCFYSLFRIEQMLSHQPIYLKIHQELAVLIKLMSNIPDIQTKHYCLRFINTKLEALSENTPEINEIRTSLFP